MYFQAILVSSLLLCFGHQCQADCPDGWTSFGDKCYFFSHTAVSWAEAHNLCKLMFQGDLAAPESEQENTLLTNHVKFSGHYYWIGGNDMVENNVWQWAKTMTLLTIQHWAQGEPNGVGTDSDCMLINMPLGQGRWADAPCKDHHYFICERLIPQPSPASQVQDSFLVG